MQAKEFPFDSGGSNYGSGIWIALGVGSGGSGYGSRNAPSISILIPKIPAIPVCSVYTLNLILIYSSN